jgi:RNA polymerase sigma-70 factor (ECF subfamily)
VTEMDTSSPSASDAELARRAIAGDARGFEALVRRYEAAVFSHVLRMVRNRDDAMELAQDTFLKAYRHLAQYDPARSFRTWLLTIATNTALNRLEARRVRRLAEAVMEENVRLGEYAAGRNPSPSEEVGRREMLELIEDSLRKVSAKARAIFMLRYNHGLSCEEIASAMGETVSNVKVSLLRTRERLRRELQVE